MNLYEQTKFIMKQNNITANKKLGQNFLIDENVVENIINASDISKEDLVIEIGPGLGTLTEKLLEKAGKVICIELDHKMVQLLTKRFKLYTNFEIINDDILKINLKELINQNKGFKKTKIVANLPYYITTPIIMKLLEDKLNIESITVMIQKEVAHRLAEKPGGKECGSITYTIWYYTSPDIILEVPNTSFIPEPEVNSSVIKFNILKEPRIKVENEEKFFKLIKLAFMQKRKTLINALLNGRLFKNREEAEKCLNELNIDPKIRGEKLTLEQYNQLANKIENCKLP